MLVQDKLIIYSLEHLGSGVDIQDQLSRIINSIRITLIGSDYFSIANGVNFTHLNDKIFNCQLYCYSSTETELQLNLVYLQLIEYCFHRLGKNDRFDSVSAPLMIAVYSFEHDRAEKLIVLSSSKSSIRLFFHAGREVPPIF